MIATETPREAPLLLMLVLAAVFMAGFCLPAVTAPAEASAPIQVIVVGARVAPALM